MLICGSVFYLPTAASFISNLALPDQNRRYKHNPCDCFDALWRYAFQVEQQKGV